MAREGKCFADVTNIARENMSAVLTLAGTSIGSHAGRCTQVVMQPAPILASVSYMYGRCIAGVYQVSRNPLAIFSRVKTV